MRKNMMRTLAFMVSAGFACTFLPSSASGQALHDHLECFKIKDPHKFRARADLVPEQTEFAADAACLIKVRSKEFCIPVQKDRVTVAGDPKQAPTAAVVGQELDNDFLCYKMKCRQPGQQPTNQEVTDQFGTRDLRGFKVVRICTPTIKGSLPTTTTTTLGTGAAKPCNDPPGSAPSCPGFCVATGEACLPFGPDCDCVAELSPCGSVAGPPDCLGACPPLEACVDVGGTCVCQP